MRTAVPQLRSRLSAFLDVLGSALFGSGEDPTREALMRLSDRDLSRLINALDTLGQQAPLESRRRQREYYDPTSDLLSERRTTR